MSPYNINANYTTLPVSITSLQCGMLFWTSPIATILDFKSRGRLGRVESTTKGVGIRLIERGGREERRKTPLSCPLLIHSPQLPKILQIQHGGYD